MRIRALDYAVYSAYLNYHIWKTILFISAFTGGHSFTFAKNFQIFQILWGRATNRLFPGCHTHKQQKLNLILQTVMIIANLLVTGTAQDRDLGVQGTRRSVIWDQ